MAVGGLRFADDGRHGAREDAVFRARPADARHYAAGLKTAKRREGRNPCGVSEFNLIRGKEKSV
ncbi:hypothetical protein DIP74_05965 [Neisseria gonorrhoeae]